MNEQLAIVASVVAALAGSARADGIDDLARSLDAGSAEQMAAVGVFGRTVDRLKDPRSIQLISVFVKHGQNVLTGCMQYRSKNSFGGYTPGFSVWHLTAGKSRPALSFTTDDASKWNSRCVGKGFTDKTELINAALNKMREKL